MNLVFGLTTAYLIENLLFSDQNVAKDWIDFGYAQLLRSQNL